MRLLAVGDVHWSQYSSILRGRDIKYSSRLTNLIKSVNWAEKLSDDLDCELVIYLGDFFDKEFINSEEISALNEIKWSLAHHIFLVGNHEMGRNDLLYSSEHIFNLIDNAQVIAEPKTVKINDFTELAFLPYVLEEARKPIEDYFPKSMSSKRIIFSHNDLAGIQMGKFVSKNGFDLKNIEDNCDLFINGHLHNGDKITKKIFNVGNLTGQNFSEDAEKYDHCVFVIDTDTLKIEVYENPEAYNFYKLDATEHPIDVTKLKANSVVTLKCLDKDIAQYKEALSNNQSICESKVLVQNVITGAVKEDIEQAVQKLSLDHLKGFQEYILNTLGDSDIVKEVLSQVVVEAE